MGYIRFDGEPHHKLQVPDHRVAMGGEILKLDSKTIKKLLADPTVAVTEVRVTEINPPKEKKDKDKDKNKSEAKSAGQKSKEEK